MIIRLIDTTYILQELAMREHRLYQYSALCFEPSSKKEMRIPWAGLMFDRIYPGEGYLLHSRARVCKKSVGQN